MTSDNNSFRPQIAFHPGETLAEKLKELCMGPKEFAIRSGKPEKTVIAILNGNSSITPEMAVQFEHVLKIPAHFWLNMQSAYDEYVARKERFSLVSESIAWAKKFPFREMVKRNWISDQDTIEAKTSELLAFFGFSSHNAWENYYLHQELKVVFRISLAHMKAPYAISAWLRRGDLQALELPAHPYDEKRFKEVLPLIKHVMAEQPKDFFQQLQALCLSAGVKVVHTPCIPKAPVHGCTRWIQDAPIIQLTGRYKRNDIFWFTFFHEAGHILLHGKKDIFLENIEYSEKDIQKESEANHFAVKWTFTKAQQEEIQLKPNIKIADIVEFAKQCNTHPAIILGRLQHDKMVPPTFGRNLFVPVYLDEE
jgi:HTH-type transcriptional regulator / antitoxin HigA